MRKARDEQNNRLFDREQWLTKSQVQGFFSRLAATRRRHQPNPQIDEYGELLLEDEEADRQQLIEEIAKELRPQHPLSYDAFNLCECARKNKLNEFSVGMLKQILRHFDVPFKSKDRKNDLIVQLMSFIEECECFN